MTTQSSKPPAKTQPPGASSGRALVVLLGLSLLPVNAQAQLSSTGDQFWHQDSPDILGTNETGDGLGEAVATGDFNNDGFDDLAIGAREENIGDLADAGTVHVIYGAEGGLNADGNQVWSQETAGIAGAPESGDRFGSSLATGDFNGDGFDDLAIGSPGEDVGGISNAGAVNVIYGAPGGLTDVGDSIWTQDTAGIEDVAEAGDQFGASLASGDFNDDGYDDLAIGARGEDIGADTSTGAVNVLYGSAAGFVIEGNQFWHQDTPGIAGANEDSDEFGWSLATGDFDNDSYDDLAIGVRGEDVSAIVIAGAVNVIYGTAEGLATAGNQVWTQNTTNILEVAELGDQFGWALAAGDFNSDGFCDLAIGVPGENLPGAADAGLVNVIYGAAGGLSSVGNQIFSQDTPGIAGIAEEGNTLGESFATGDFDNDGFYDLAIGVNREDIGALAAAGAVNVIYGRAGGLSAEGNQAWFQSSAGVMDESEASDVFGDTLAAGDFDLDGFDNLAIGVPLEDLNGVDDAGAVNVLYGGSPEALVTDLLRQIRALQALRGVLARMRAMFP